MSSFEELMKQVESLKAENSSLRRELQDNSSHLTKLETEAGNMKDVLTHLHSAMQDESHSDLSEMNSFTQNDSILSSNQDNMLDHNSNASGDEPASETGWAHHQAILHQTFQHPPPPVVSQPTNRQPPQQAKTVHQRMTSQDTLLNFQKNTAIQKQEQATSVLCASDQNLNSIVKSEEGDTKERETPALGAGNRKASHIPSPTEGPAKKRSGEKELYSYVQELNQERKALLQEIENEERQRKCYCEQLEALHRQADDLPTQDKYNVQTDMSRRQLDYEIQRLHNIMKENMGSSEEISQRHKNRLQRIQRIETDMMRAQQMHKEQLQKSSEDQTVKFQEDSNLLATSSQSSKETVSPVAQNQKFDSSTPALCNVGHFSTIATQTLDSTEAGCQSKDGNPSNQNLSALYHGSWPLGRDGQPEVNLSTIANQETVSLMSFQTNNTSSTRASGGYMPTMPYTQPHQHLGTKVEMVYGLLSMLGTHDKEDMSRTLLAMSSSQDSCIAMRQSGCLPLLIQLLHGSDTENGLLGKTRGSKAARARASAALHNIVHSHPDDKRGRREARVLRLLEQIRAHCDQLRTIQGESEEPTGSEPKTDMDHHPGPAIAALMKLSFDEEHRHAICTLGGLQAIAELLQVDHSVNGNTAEQYNITMRRYACMALTNLTFGDGTNKALLCSMKPAMFALVSQLQSPNEDLRQVAASVLRNLSWRADLASKKVLREVGSVTSLMQAAMDVQKESTLKSVLSALWNLSAHCSENKADVCKVEGALAFLVATLSYKSPSKTLSIIENGGGILRNISSHIAIREEYRQVLRKHGCLKILLKHLRSPSLTIVSNACGTLWNLSARCAEDQKALWEMGAVSMLKNLVNSKHKMISMGSAAAIKNLLNARNEIGIEKDNLFGNTNKPGLHIRKKMALEAEIDPNLSETCDNMESPTDSPTHTTKHHDQRNNKFRYMVASDGHQMYGQHSQSSMPVNLMYNHPRMIASDMSPFIGQHPGRVGPSGGFTKPVSRSGSQDSVGSVHSDISHDRTRQMLLKTSQLLDGKNYGSPRHSMSRSQEHHRSRSGSSDRSHPEHPSRIVQMMQEVANSSGLDSRGDVKDATHFSLKESHSADNTPQVLRRSQAQHASFHEMPKQKARAQLVKPSGNSSYSAEAHNNSSHSKNSHLSVSHLSRNMENLHLSLGEEENEDERPVDFSMKYTDNDTEHNTEAVSRSFSSSYNSAFRPNPQVNNYVGYSKTPKDGQSSINTSGVPRKTYAPAHKSRQTVPNNSKKPWLDGELDNPSDEQPTNFSVRYVEEEEDHAQDEDQPIDFSKHFSDKESPPVSKPLPQSLPHYQQHLSSMDDDQVKTFCTEGTPLNFLSTATSLTDLSKVDDSEHDSNGSKSKGSHDLDASRDETTDFASRNTEHDVSRSDSQPSDRNTASTVTASKTQLNTPQEKSDSPKSSLGSKSSCIISQIPSLYSYNDNSSMSASPSEKPVKYCTEGTPNSFSRRSSLSSLHSGDTDNLHKQDLTLQAIDENDSLDTSHNITLKAENVNSSVLHKNNTSQSGDSVHPAHSKTVTFDSNVQETPLMFSRCSSLGSLSSFDAHSVHSSVMSDYSTSRRTSGMVSPSELPDSPSDTMPPTPSLRRSPPPTERSQQDKQMDSASKDLQVIQEKELLNQDSINSSTHKLDTVSKCDTDALQTPRLLPAAVRLPLTSNEMAKTYAEEGSPEFSCATSLSALTFEDEPVIEKDPTLKRIPLGVDDGKSDKTASTQSPDNEKEELDEKADKSDDDDDIDFDDGNDSPVSESEENMLAECIEMAMPPSSKKKMKKSTSDGALKTASSASRLPMASHIPHAATVGRNLNKAAASNIPKPASVASPARAGLKLPSQSVPRYPPEFYEGYDSPKNYATEGTPLNFSRATSLSDLTIDDHTGDGQEGDTTLKAWQDDSNQTGDLDLSDDGDEDLLSEVIEAAMPKSKKHQPKISSETNKQQSPTKENKIAVSKSLTNSRPEVKARKEILLPRQPSIDQKKSAIAHYQRQIPIPRTYGQRPANNKPGMATHVQPERIAEGSEGSFSKCQLTKPVPHKPVVLVEECKDTQDEETPPPLPPRMAFRTQTCGDDDHQGDTLRTYAVEGTPLEFSRATSLSDLTDIHDFDSDLQEKTKERKSEINEKTSSAVEVVDSKDNKSTMENNGDEGMRDITKTYAVEDTPYNFSRRTSFSDLTVDTDDGEKNENLSNDLNDTGTTESTSQNITVYQKVYTPGTMSVIDSPRHYNVEGTPLNYSRTGSLSSLSFDEDLDNEPPNTANKNQNSDIKEDDSKQGKQAQIPSRKPGIQSPAIARLRTANKPFKYQPSMHSTPMVKPSQNMEQDQLMSYAVEDTPNAYSRHSSLSSLDSNDHEGLANQSGGSGGSDPVLGARESPAKKEGDLSRHDSFSSLSVESLSFEPSESENALLEECISSAMPKSNKKKKKDTGASGLLSDHPVRNEENSQEVLGKTTHPKNEEGPQAENSDTKDTSEVHNQNNNNKILEQVEQESENSEEAEIDANKLAQTFADLENKFAELGMGSVSVHENQPGNLCLEANSNLNNDRKEISPSDKSVDSLETDIEKSTPSEVKNVHFIQDITPSEKSTDSLEMSSSKMSLGQEARYIIDVIQREREMAPSDRSTDSLDMASSKPFESGESDIVDIMKESFPDMTSSLVSNITTPDKDNLPILGENILSTVEEKDGNLSNASSNRTDSTQNNSGNVTAIFRDGRANSTIREEFELPDSTEDSFNITAEEEKLLEENANIILSELSNMVSSQITNDDDDAFIQNEKISLVGSTDPSSSEVSMVASLTRPIKVSESLTEDGDSVATVIHTGSFHDLDSFDLPDDIVKPKPRIVKPDTSRASMAKEETPKSVRGGKKVYKGRPPPANAARLSPPSWKSPSPAKVVTYKKTPESSKPITPTAKKTPGKSLTKPATNVIQSKLNKQSPKQNDTASPVAGRRTNTPPRSSPISNIRSGIAKPSPLAQTKQREVSRSPKPSNTTKLGNNSNGSRIQAPKASKIATPNGKSPRPSGLPKPSQSYIKSPGNGTSKSNTSQHVSRKKKEEEPRPQMPAKQGTFVKEEPSQYVLCSEDINIDTDSKQKKPKDSPPLSHRYSDELKYKAEESGKHTPTPIQEKEIDTKVASPVKTPSDKSDHGAFTVEEYSGAWEGTGFTVMAFTGAWQDARLRRRSGSCSGSGSCSETPPIKRRSYVFDDSFETASGEPSTQDNVFASENEVAPVTESTKDTCQSAEKDNTTAQVRSPSRLPQSLLPKPGSRSTSSSTSSVNKSDSAKHNSSNNSDNLNKSGLKPLTKPKPATPPRASSLPKGNSASRSSTPQGRSLTPQSRSLTPQGRNFTSEGRKNSVDSLQSRSSTPQGRKSSLSGVSGSTARPSPPPKQSHPPKKATTSKIASLWKKDKKDDKDSKNSRSQKAMIKSASKDKSKNKNSEASSMKRSGTYDKLVIMAGAPDIDGSSEASENMPPPSAPPPTKKLWRRTYTISDEQNGEEPVSVEIFVAKPEDDPMLESATSSQDEGGTIKKGKEKRKSLWRRSKDPEVKKEKSETSKKRFSLFRRDSSDAKAEAVCKTESKIPGMLGKKGKGGIWLKRKSDAENDMNSPNGDPVIELDKDSFHSSDVYINGNSKPNAAVVAPFNYKPSHLAVKPVQQEAIIEQVKDQSIEVTKERPLTKTEMLMARRRKSNNINSGSEASLESEDSRKASSSYLVTTV